MKFLPLPSHKKSLTITPTDLAWARTHLFHEWMQELLEAEPLLSIWDIELVEQMTEDGYKWTFKLKDADNDTTMDEDSTSD